MRRLLYDEARPGYPETLFDDIVSLSGIPDGGRILEIGCGTGQATVPFARRGYRILCVELGENMAAVARRNLEVYPQTDVRTGAFEEWPLHESAFDLAISATAFHWLDPAVAYPKVARALRYGGSLALFWNVHVHSDASEGFFEAAPRRRSTSARRRRSLVPKTTKDSLGPTRSRTGRARSRIPACSAAWSDATTGGTKRTTPRAIYAY